MISTDILLLVLRVVLGLLFFGHGTQKLFGWWGGRGIEGTSKMLASLNIQPDKFWALIAGLGETLGGLGLVLGLYTPIAGALIVSVMLMAIIKVHWKNGLWNSNRGMEYQLLNIAVASVVGLSGPGLYSLDSLLNISYPMPWTFIIAVVLGILGVLAGLGSSVVTGQTQKMRGAEH